MAAPKNVIKTSFFTKYRYYIITAAVLLFLPPLSFIFQFTGDSNFCGSWCPRMFFLWRENMTLSQYLIGFVRSYMGVILVISILLSTFFLGRIWCSHLCPVGGVLELGSRLVPGLFRIDFSAIPAPSLRYGYLTAYFGAAALGIGSLCCSYCNLAAVPRLFGAVFSQADFSYFLRTAGIINLGLLFFLGFFAKGGRAYCNLLCPIGALDALSNKIGERSCRRININHLTCSSCGKCSDVCPVWAINTENKTIDQLSCIPCGKCEVICPQNAVSYGKIQKSSILTNKETANETVKK